MESYAFDSAMPAGEDIAFLHRLDGVSGEAQIVLTDRARLQAASFLDGREVFWRAERIVPLELPTATQRRPRRFIFHVGFCGSTLLARLLDRPGQVLALKEPQCLADVAGQRQALAAGEGVASMHDLLEHAIERLVEVGDGDVTVVVKPTNWVNVVLPQLCAPGVIDRALFVSMDRRAYLNAAFRGGRTRLEFCIRLAAEVSAAVPDGGPLLAEAIAAGGDPLDRSARIVAVLHAQQEHLFDRAIAANDWPASVRIDFAHLVQHPAGVLRRARKLLGLEPVVDEPERADQLMERHTKDPSAAFRPGRRLREDGEVEAHHASRFDAALDWLEGAWAPIA